MDHQSQMMLQQQQLQQQQQQQQQQHHAMMSGHMPQHMQMMHMQQQQQQQQQQQDVKPPTAAGKKRKKATARAQNAQPPVGMMNGPPGMDPRMTDPMAMMGGSSSTIVAQNPFDDFADPCLMQPVRLPPQQGQPTLPPHPSHPQQGQPPQQFMPQNSYFSQQNQQTHSMLMSNGGPSSMQMNGGPSSMQMNGGPSSMQMNGGPSSMQMNGGPNSMQMMQHPGAPLVRQGVPDQSDRVVYPEDRCMITNPQNPNAPPIYPCGACHREVHENGHEMAIFCESGCNFWYHRGCTGLTELAHKLLSSEVYAEWACDSCIKRNNVPFVKIKP